MRAEKDRLLVELAKVPFLKPVPSDSNFVLCEVVAGLDAKTVYDALRAKGIIIRFFGAQGGDLSNYIRISAGKPADTDKVLAALAVSSGTAFRRLAACFAGHVTCPVPGICVGLGAPLICAANRISLHSRAV